MANIHRGRDRRISPRRYTASSDVEDLRDIEIARLQREVEELRFNRNHEDDAHYDSEEPGDQWECVNLFADAPRGFRRYHHDASLRTIDMEVEQLFNLEYVPEPFVNEYDFPIYDTDGEEDETDSRSSLPEEREESKGLQVISKLADVCDPVVNDVDDGGISYVYGVKADVASEDIKVEPFIEQLNEVIENHLDVLIFNVVDSRTSLSEEGENDVELDTGQDGQVYRRRAGFTSRVEDLLLDPG